MAGCHIQVVEGHAHEFRVHALLQSVGDGMLALTLKKAI